MSHVSLENIFEDKKNDYGLKDILTNSRNVCERQTNDGGFSERDKILEFIKKEF